MRTYWIRVALGALAVFVIGMMFVTGIRATKNKATAALAEMKTGLGGNASRAMLAGLRDSLAFKLDGVRLGSLRRIKIDKELANTVPDVTALVALDSGVDPARVRSCDIVPLSQDQMDQFRCADSAEGGLQTVGKVTFDGAGFDRHIGAARGQLLAERHQRQHRRQSRPHPHGVGGRRHRGYGEDLRHRRNRGALPQRDDHRGDVRDAGQ